MSIAKGAAWTAGAQWVVQLTQFATSILLARLLSPDDYGLLAMVLVYIGFVTLFSHLGMAPALIQRATIDDGHVCTAFWTTTAASVVLFVLSYVAAPAVAEFFQDPRLVPIVRVTALALLLSPLNAILYSLLRRKMAFRSLAKVDVAAAVASQAVAVVTALSGWGVWALVAAQIANPLVRLPMLLRLNRWLPSLRFQADRFWDLFGFSSNVLGFNIINYGARNLDKVIIGRLLGPTPLGFYDISYQIMLKPLQNVSHTVSAPLFPALSSIQHDKTTAAEIYRRVCFYIALITFPMMAGIALVADDFILVAIGEKWAPAIPILQILCLVGAMQSVGSTVGDVYMSQGRSDIMLKWALVTTPVIGLAYYIGTYWNIVGVAAAYAIISLPLWIISHAIANQLIALNGRRFWMSFVPIIIHCSTMAIAVTGVRFVCDLTGMAELTRLIASVSTGAVVYGAILALSPHPDIASARIKLMARVPGALRWTKDKN